MKMRDGIYLPQTNIKYKIVKLVLLWSFYSKKLPTGRPQKCLNGVTLKTLS